MGLVLNLTLTWVPDESCTTSSKFISVTLEYKAIICAYNVCILIGELLDTVAELKYRTIFISNSDLPNLSNIYWILKKVH